MFSVEVDPVHSVIAVTREGFFSLDEMQQSVDAVRVAVANFRGAKFRLLADFRAFKPANAAVAEKLAEILAHTYRSGAERVAHVVSSSVMLLQIRRLAKETGIANIARQFDDREAALRWLITGDDTGRL